MMNYKKVYNVEKMLADHARPVRYELPTRAEPNAPITRPALYVHAPRGRAARSIDDSTERFVEETRVGTSSSKSSVDPKERNVSA
jgi:hypothetical protein